MCWRHLRLAGWQRRAWARLRDDHGIALVITLSIMLALSIAAMSAVQYTSSIARTGRLNASRDVAYRLAEAGLNSALAVINNSANNPTQQNILPSTQQTASTASYTGGTSMWWGVYSNGTWTVYGLGTASNPSGSAASTRTLNAQVDVTLQTAQPLGSQAWNSIYAWHIGSLCDMTISNNGQLAAPLYVRGNLCLSNNSSLTTGPVNALGSLTLNNGANVGSSGTPLNQVHVKGGCSYSGGAYHKPCTSADHVWATTSDASPVDIAAPTADFAYWYANARPGPANPCTTSSGSIPVFDNDQTLNTSVPGSFNLAPTGSDYTCIVNQGNQTIGELAWNHSTKTLTVAGVVYIDGSATIPQNAVVTYSGMATLYLSGTLLLPNNAQLCAVVSGSLCNQTSGAWDPNSRMLIVVCGGSGGQVPAGDGAQLSNNSGFQGAIYATNQIEMANNAQVQGPLAASTMILSNNVHDTFPLIVQVPVGAPGNADGYTTTISAPRAFTG